MDSFRALTAAVRFNKHAPANAHAISLFNPAPSKKRKRETDNPRIRSTGSDVPSPIPDFSQLSHQGCPACVLANLAEMAIDQPSGIQMQAIPILLSGRDLLACAPTGSGKTLAFLIPLLIASRSAKKGKGPSALVIEPTRELARQVCSEARRLSKGTDWKTVLLNDEQEQAAECDLLVTTPNKLVYMLKDGTVDLSGIRHLVFDEADKLFELGFLEQTDSVIAACPKSNIQKALFSATIPSGVEEMGRSVMASDVIRVIVGQNDAATSTITQELVFAGTEEGKLLAIKNLLTQGGLVPPVLIFVQSIDRAKELFKELAFRGINSDVIHGDRKPEERDRVIEDFRSGKVWVLVCTDVMGRGVDFKGVNLVINYDFPQSAQSYIHRIGRTGRAGRPGKAVTYFTSSDATHLKSIVNVMRNSGCEVPQWMLELKAPSQKEKKQLRKAPVKRKDISETVGAVAGKAKGRKKRKADGVKKEKRPQKQVEASSDDDSD